MTAYVISSGVSATYEVGPGDSLTVLSGGASEKSTIAGVLTVSSGGRAVGGEILAGAADILYRGGKESHLEVQSGAVLALDYLVVTSGRAYAVETVGTTYALSGAILDAGAGVWALNATVEAGGFLDVGSGGLAVDATVNASGGVYLDNGGVLAGGHIKSGGVLDGPGEINGVVNASGLVASVHVTSGAKLNAAYTGTDDVTVEGGGRMVAENGAFIDSATVDAGGVLSLESGTSAGLLQAVNGTLVDNGYAIFDQMAPVHFGGSLSGLGTIIAGGVEGSDALILADHGRSFRGALDLVSGTVEIATSDAIGHAIVNLDGASVTLTLDTVKTGQPSTDFPNGIAGFYMSTQQIDLPNLAYVTGAYAYTADGLQVREGGESYNFVLVGLGATSFTISEDKTGGTLVTPLSGITTRPGAIPLALMDATAAFGGGEQPGMGEVVPERQLGADVPASYSIGPFHQARL